MPPCLGVSSAATASGAAMTAAPSSAAASSDPILIASSRSAELFVEPHSRQILVEIMAGTDLPAFHIRTVKNSAIIPQQEYLVGLVVENVFLEVAHQGPLLGELGFMQHPIVQIDFLLVLELAIARDVDRMRQISLDVEQWVNHTVAIAIHGSVEVAIAHRFEPRAGRQDPLRDMKPDLAPLIDYPGRVVFIGLVDIAVHQLKAEPLGPRFVQQAPCFCP